MENKVTFCQKLTLLAFGGILTLFILETTLRIGGFLYLSFQDYRNSVSDQYKNAYRILCLGDSTTAFGGEYAYPRQLEQILNQKKSEIQFAVINKGIPGVDTSAILSRLEYNLKTYNPQIVIVMMGINDDTHDYLYTKNAVVSKIKSFIRTLRVYKIVALMRARIDAQDTVKDMYIEQARYCLEFQRYSEAYQLLLKSRALVPNDPVAHILLAWYYYEQGEITRSYDCLAKAKSLAGLNYAAYIELGWHYFYVGLLSDSEEMFKKAIESKPKDHNMYCEIAQFYQSIGRHSEAEDMFRKAIALAKDNDKAYIELGWFCYERGRTAQAEEMFKKAIEINSRSFDAISELARHYRKMGNYTLAEKCFKKAIELNPQNEDAYINLAWCYHSQGNPILAGETLKRALAINPEVNNIYIKLVRYYEEKHNYAQAQEMLGALIRNAKKTKKHLRKTQYNFNKLKDMVMDRKMELVYVQYPMRRVKDLIDIFNSTEGVTFVDNEMLFKEAVVKTSYGDYFNDKMGGDFGHCTVRGNRLLAENVADAVLKVCGNAK